jgi:hypothetical protein
MERESVTGVLEMVRRDTSARRAVTLAEKEGRLVQKRTLSDNDITALHGRIEELDLGPGQEREVLVCYCPSTSPRGCGSSAGEGPVSFLPVCTLATR